MAFFSSKKFLIPLVSIASITAITTTVGVIYASSNKQTTNSVEENKNNEKNEVETNTSLNTAVNKIDLKKLLSEINQESIVIHPYSEKNEDQEKVELNKQINKSDLFAFNIKTKQLSLKSKIPQGVSISFSLDKTKNTPISLNEGKLHISINASQTGSKEEKQEVELTGFKKPDMKLINLFETNDKNLLTITPKNESSDASYITIEQLNKITKTFPLTKLVASQNKSSNRVITLHDQENATVNKKTQTISGLTTWLRNDQNKKANTTDVYIYGEVKLDEIKNEGDKTYFYLSSTDLNNPLKLVSKKDGNIESEAIIGSIKTTNLLATDVTLTPIVINQQNDQKYLDILKAIENEKGYIKDIEKNSFLNRNIAIDLAKKQERVSETKTNLVFIKPYTLTNVLNDKDKKLPIKLLVHFGSDENIKTFDTSNQYDLEILKATGFSFDIYSKKLTKTDLKLESSELTNEMLKLDSYFKQENYSKPVAKPVTSDSSNGIKTTTITSSNIKNPIEIMFDMVDKQKPANYILFASYSYKGLDNKNMNTVFNPSLSLMRNGELTEASVVIEK